MIKYVVLSTMLVAYIPQPRLPPVAVESGWLAGTVGAGGRYHQYLGVPYAYTDRSRRFQSALRALPWEGVYYADDEHVRCPQRFTPNLVLGQENCLTLNIFTPTVIQKPLPVMVYFHGGGFREGSNSPNLYGPDYLVDKDVILVAANYRVEILGFLCLGISEAPGNVGLKDQVEALKWVQRNIKAFGGDPDKVTIFGESAGGSAVSYHTLSPMSKGLFHKAIIQSGSAISPWSFQHDPVGTAIRIAEQMGLKTKDPHELHTFFMTKSAEDLLRTRVPRETGSIILSETIFVPCVETNIPGVEAFITDSPYNLLRAGRINKVPMIIGHNNAEGYMFAGKENSTTIPKIDIRKSLPRDLQFPTDDERQAIATKVKEMYLGQDEIKKETMGKLANFYGAFFKYPVVALTELMSKHSDMPIYAYKFCHDGWQNIAKFFFGFAGHPGATHADDLFYMFKAHFVNKVTGESKMIDRITTMWTNFAKTSNPTPSKSTLLPTPWLPVNPRRPEAFTIADNMSMGPLWDDDTVFWNQTYTKYRRKT